jgi:pilus assembly protein Flp/PilA
MEGDMVTATFARLRLAWFGLWGRVRGQDGATAVEYALMLALIAVVVIGAVTLLGQNASTAYANPALNSAIGGGS